MSSWFMILKGVLNALNVQIKSKRYLDKDNIGLLPMPFYIIKYSLILDQRYLDKDNIGQLSMPFYILKYSFLIYYY